jgi:hypothetical protein
MMERLGWPEGGETGRALSSIRTRRNSSRGSGNLQTGDGLTAMEFEQGYVKASQQAMS